MNRCATFTLYVSIPPEYGEDEMEVTIQKMIEFLATGRIATLNATWSCPGLGKRTYPPGPVLVFCRDDVPKDTALFINPDGTEAGRIVGLKTEEE